MKKVLLSLLLLAVAGMLFAAFQPEKQTLALGLMQKGFVTGGG